MERLLPLLLATALLLPLPAQARKVYSPRVEPGAVELESQTDVTTSADPARDGAIKQQIEIAHGVRAWWSTGLYLVLQRPSASAPLRYAAAKWANILLLPAPDGLDLGLYLEYIAPAAGGSDVLEGKLLIEARPGRWRHTANLVWKATLAGGGGAPSLGYAWHTGYRATERAEIGLQAFGALGPMNRLKPPPQQSHLVGPVARIRFGEETDIELGWLLDVNAGAREGDLKLNVELEF